MDVQGQITMEFVLLVGIIFPVILGICVYIGDDAELSQSMAAARTGAMEGSNLDSFAIYPKDAFDNNNDKYQRLNNPSNVKIINIDYKNFGFNATYNKTRIQLHITASCSSVKNFEKSPLSDRINFYARKRISESFGTSSQTNSAFNPAYSNKYVFTTADVKWI
ncbi:MAG TPA: hypothetical protein VK426_05605 [Methanobacterium sp.]|nr:hypothetical protein [Methanobacterium sp.]